MKVVELNVKQVIVTRKTFGAISKICGAIGYIDDAIGETGAEIEG